MRWTFSSKGGEDWSAGPWQQVVSVVNPQSVRGRRLVDNVDLYLWCQCPAFLYWGSQALAEEHNYIPPRRNRGVPPADIRNPQRDSFICKHLISAANILKNYVIENVQEEGEGIPPVPVAAEKRANVFTDSRGNELSVGDCFHDMHKGLDGEVLGVNDYGEMSHSYKDLMSGEEFRFIDDMGYNHKPEYVSQYFLKK